MHSYLVADASKMKMHTRLLGNHKTEPYKSDNSFLASSDFCRLLFTFAKILDPDQDRNVGPDLDTNCLTL